jgi:Rrf2 family nitric oxide-sensitive transcriptional repressor
LSERGHLARIDNRLAFLGNLWIIISIDSADKIMISYQDVNVLLSFFEADMFSQTAEYALRAVVYLASKGGTAQTAQQIAEATRVQSGYLSKVMQTLVRADLVHSQRGLHGGFTLARSADELTVLDVVQAVTPIRRIESCPLGLKGHINLCPLHRRLDNAIGLVEDALRQSTIAELLAEPDRSRGIPIPLCSDEERPCGRRA